jgi:ATP-binding cassette subfamily F protein uup
LRQQLDENKSARENITDGTDFLIINDQKRHVMGFLQDFLFSPDRAQTLVRYLSGGERNRLLLARMMSRPANVLVLDEPTNDLDVETLELLEELLPSFSGTVLLVSHDRAFINNVVTSTIVFTGDGSLEEFDGGYDDWQRVSAQRPAVAVPASAEVADSSPSVTRESGPAATRRKLSWREQRELEELPDRIATLEARQKELHDTMSRPDFYQSGGTAIAEVAAELNQVAMDLANAYDRWQMLEE